jgi:hypothetical protein
MQEVKNPYPIFLGLDGLALELGYIYIGLENQDPETNPKSCFWDVDGTQSATQPIRTLASYPDRNGSPAQIFTSGKYSIRVRDALGNQVFYLASAGENESVSAGQPYLIHTQYLGDPPGVQTVVMKHIFGLAVSLEADLPDQAFFHVGTNPGSNCAFDMRKNDISFGTLTISTSGALTVVCSATDFAIGDRFELKSPAGATSLANIGGVIIGTTA